MPIVTGEVSGWGYCGSPTKGASVLPPARRRALLATLDPQVLESVVPAGPRRGGGGGRRESAEELEPLLGLLRELGVAPDDQTGCSEVTDFARQLRSARRAAAAHKGRSTALVPAPPRTPQLGQRPDAAVDPAVLRAASHWLWDPVLYSAVSGQSQQAAQHYRALQVPELLQRGGERAAAVCRVQSPWATGTGILIEPSVVLTSAALVATPDQARRVRLTFFADSAAPCPPCEFTLEPRNGFGCTAGTRFRYAVLRVPSPDSLVLACRLRQSDAPIVTGGLLTLDCAADTLFVVQQTGEDEVTVSTSRREPHEVLEGSTPAGDGVLHSDGAVPGCTVCTIAADSSRDLSARQEEALRMAAAAAPSLEPRAEGGKAVAETVGVSAVSHPPAPGARGDADKVVCTGGLRIKSGTAVPSLLQTDSSVCANRWLTEGAPVFSLAGDWRLLGIAVSCIRPPQDRAVAMLLRVDTCVRSLQRQGCWDAVTGRVTQGLGCIDAPKALSPTHAPSPPSALQLWRQPRPSAAQQQHSSRLLVFSDDCPPELQGRASVGAGDGHVLHLPPFSVELRASDGLPDPSASGPGCSVSLSAEALDENGDPTGPQLRVERPQSPLLRGRARFHSAAIHPTPRGRFRIRAVACIAFRGTVRYPLALRHLKRRRPLGDGTELLSAALHCDPIPEEPETGGRRDEAASAIQRAARSKAARVELAKRQGQIERYLESARTGQPQPALAAADSSGLRCEAATRIQSAQRSKVARQQLRAKQRSMAEYLGQGGGGARHDNAAVKIQCAQRSRAARKKRAAKSDAIAVYLAAAEDPRRDEAASAIQRAQRCRSARANRSRREAAIARYLRTLDSREDAAGTIQRAMRSSLARSSLARRQRAIAVYLAAQAKEGGDEPRAATSGRAASPKSTAKSPSGGQRVRFSVPDAPEVTLSAPQGARHIRILHFNDVYHTEVRGNPVAARLATALQTARKKSRDSLTIFSGDGFSPSIHATVTKGAHMPPVLNQLGVQCSVVGNHDLDFGPDRLDELSKQCTFPWLLTNVTDTSRGGAPLGGAKRTEILPVQAADGSTVRVGFMGIVEEDWILTCGQINVAVTRYHDMVEEARKAASELRQQGAHVVIALTHMRTPNDTLLADKCGSGVLDMVLGGHDHDAEKLTVNGVPIVKSGSDFLEFSEVDIRVPECRFHPGGGVAPGWVERGGETGVCTVQSELIEDVKNTFDPDPDMLVVMKEVTDKINSGLGRVVAVTGNSFDCTSAAVRTGEAPIGNWITDVARWGFHHVACDMAILQGGCMRANRTFAPGPIRLGDLLAIIPIEDPIVVIELTGAQLRQALEGGLSKYPAHDGRFPQMSGLRVSWSPSAPPGQRVRQIWSLSADECLASPNQSPRAVKAARGFQGYELTHTQSSSLGDTGDSPLSSPGGSVRSALSKVRRQEYTEVRDDQLYRLATSDYLARGKDGYAAFADCKRIVDTEQGAILPNMLRNYLYLQRSLHKTLLPNGHQGIRSHETTLLGPSVLVKKMGGALLKAIKRQQGSECWTEHLSSPFVGLLYPEMDGRLVSVDKAVAQAAP